MMAPPVYAPSFTPDTYPAPTYGGPPVVWQPSGMPQPPMAAPGPTPAQQPAPRPLVRAKGPDEPVPLAPSRPAPLVMPSPEQLGVAPAKPLDGTATDWAATRQRLDRLGAVCIHLEKLPQGGYAFVCLLPTAQPGRTHRVEATASTEQDVVHLVLEKAEAWAGGR